MVPDVLPPVIDPVVSRWRRLLLLSAAAGAIAVLGDFALRTGGWWSGGYAGDPGQGAHAVLVSLADLARAGVIVAAALGVVDRIRQGGPSSRWGWAALLAALGLAGLAVGAAWGQLLLAAAASFGDAEWPGQWGEGMHARPLEPDRWLVYQAVGAGGFAARVASVASAAVFLAWVVRVVRRWRASGAAPG